MHILSANLALAIPSSSGWQRQTTSESATHYIAMYSHLYVCTQDSTKCSLEQGAYMLPPIVYKGTLGPRNVVCSNSECLSKVRHSSEAGRQIYLQDKKAGKGIRVAMHIPQRLFYKCIAVFKHIPIYKCLFSQKPLLSACYMLLSSKWSKPVTSNSSQHPC